MARLPALIDALALADGRPRKAVDHVAREVREAGGMIQTTQRGRGAAHMTPLDAAYLIIGLYGSATPSESASAAQQLSTWKGTAFGRMPAELRPLKAAPDLVHAIAAVVELAPLLAPASDLVEPPIDGGYVGPLAPPAGYAVHLLFHRPERGVWLRLARHNSKGDVWDSDEFIFSFSGPGAHVGPSAVETITRINGEIFRAAHAVLFEDDGVAQRLKPGHRASARGG